MQDQSLGAFYNSLIETIGALVHAYESLLKILIDEKEILVSSSLVKLKKNNQKKENILWHIRFLEERRKEGLLSFADRLGLKKPNLSLTDLISYFDDVEQKKSLNQLYVRFKDLVEDVKKKNAYNKRLVQSALKYSVGALNKIKDFFYEAKTYKREGRIKKEGFSSGKVISKEV